MNDVINEFMRQHRRHFDPADGKPSRTDLCRVIGHKRVRYLEQPVDGVRQLLQFEGCTRCPHSKLLRVL